MTSSIGKAIFRGSVWMISLNLVIRAIGLVSMAVLARLLVPEDFGLVAMAMSVIALTELLLAFGFDSALIQKAAPTRAHYDTVWTLKIALGALISTITAILAAPASHFYDEPRVYAVMLFLAPMTLIESAENIGVVNFRKEMEFSKEFRFRAWKKVISFVVTMTLAFTLGSYWALLVGMVVGRLAGLVLSFVMHEYRPRPCLSAGRELFAFSGWVFINTAIGSVSARLGHFFIGKIYGASALGLYTMASEISSLPATELSAPINRAAFPGFAAMSRSAGELRSGYRNVFSMVALLVLPAGVGLMLVAEPLVELLFGTKWLAAVPFVSVLAVSSAVAACSSSNYYVYLAKAKTNIPPILGALHAGSFIALLLWFFGSTGVLGVAWAELGATVVTTAVGCVILVAVTEIKAVDYLSGLWRPLIGCLVMAVGVLTLDEMWLGDRTVVADLLWKVISGAAIYIATVIGLWMIAKRPSGPEEITIQYLQSVLSVPRVRAE